MAEERSSELDPVSSRANAARGGLEFFMDSDVFRALQQDVFPAILKTKHPGEPIRVWCVECSTGAKVYSIAIALVEYLEGRSSSRTVRIFGTDINDNAIEKARKGIYTTEDLAGVSQERLKRHFRQRDGEHQVNGDVRELCVFGRHDLTRNPPFSKIDLISCRNLSLHSESGLPRSVWERLHYALRDDGVLLLSGAADPPPPADLFEPSRHHPHFFSKTPKPKFEDPTPHALRKQPLIHEAPRFSKELASFEELRHTNEELQTAKEELQAANQELLMVNDQLQSRNMELALHQVAIQKDKKLIAAILGAAKDLLVVVLDPQGRIQHFNQACQTLTGYSSEEVLGKSSWDLLAPPEDSESVRKAFSEVAGGGEKQIENRWISKDGRDLLIRWSCHAVMSNGVLDSVIATGIDVTAREEASRRARESEITIRALLETAAEAILACDEEGRIVLANQMAERMFGHSHAALVGRNLESLMPERFRARHREYRNAWFRQPRNRAMGTGLELTAIRKDGSEFPVEVSLSFMGNTEGILGVAFVSDISERKQSERTLLQYKDQLQQLTGALILAQEAGNREVARELHDVFSQELAVLGMEISSLREGPGIDREIAKRLFELGKKIGQLAADLHKTSRELHPAILEDLGLQVGMQQECESFQRATGIATEFRTSGMPGAIPPDVSLTLFRVLQESLRNVHKHSQSPRVTVRLEGSPTGIVLRIEDEGDGFELDGALRKGGLGLISMEERVRLVDGKLTVESAPSAGTTVIAFVPLGKMAISGKRGPARKQGAAGKDLQ